MSPPPADVTRTTTRCLPPLHPLLFSSLSPPPPLAIFSFGGRGPVAGLVTGARGSSWMAIRGGKRKEKKQTNKKQTRTDREQRGAEGRGGGGERGEGEPRREYRGEWEGTKKYREEERTAGAAQTNRHRQRASQRRRLSAPFRSQLTHSFNFCPLPSIISQSHSLSSTSAFEQLAACPLSVAVGSRPFRSLPVAVRSSATGAPSAWRSPAMRSIFSSIDT